MDKYLVKRGVKRAAAAAEGEGKVEEHTLGAHQPKIPCSDGVGSQGGHPVISSEGSSQAESRKEDVSITTAIDSHHQPLAPGDEQLLQVNTAVVTRFIKQDQGLNVTYYPCFFTLKDAIAIFQRLEKELSPFLYSSHTINVVKLMGKVYNIPRRQAAFGDHDLSYSFSGVTLPAHPWTPTLLKLKESVEKAIGQSFNFVLVNYYRSGLDHIGEHQDDEKELCPEAAIASLSLGQERDFVFRHREARGRNAQRKGIQPVKVCLAHGSLLLMSPPTNKEWYHSLPVRKNALQPRLNLTFRRMRRVAGGGAVRGGASGSSIS